MCSQGPGGMSWHASHWVTGSGYSLHSHPEGRNCRSLPRQPHQLLFHSLSFINSDQNCSLSPCLGKQKSFPKHQELSVSDFSHRDPAVIWGTPVSDEKEMISDVSLSHSRLSSIEHTPVAACWHSASFKYAFIPHSRLSTQQTILHYNPASHSPDCCCPLQKYLRSQVSLCYQVQQHCQ